MNFFLDNAILQGSQDEKISAGTQHISNKLIL